VELALSGNIFFSCGCADFVKKHMIWTLLNICRLPENSNLLHQLFLTDNEALAVVGNSYSVIPQNPMYKKGTNKTRKEIIQDLLSNNPRCKNQQVWTLELKKKKRGPETRFSKAPETFRARKAIFS